MSELAIIRDPAAAEALMSPVRRGVLVALREPGSATTVAKELGLPRQKVNYHVRALEAVGLVRHVEDRRRGNLSERIVTATASHYLVDSAMLHELGPGAAAVADGFSRDHLAKISARTITQLAELGERADKVGKRVPTFSLETAVRFRSAEDQAAFMDGLSTAVGELVARFHHETARGGRWFRLTVGQHPALPPETDTTDDAAPGDPDGVQGVPTTSRTE